MESGLRLMIFMSRCIASSNNGFAVAGSTSLPVSNSMRCRCGWCSAVPWRGKIASSSTAPFFVYDVFVLSSIRSLPFLIYLIMCGDCDVTSELRLSKCGNIVLCYGKIFNILRSQCSL